MTSQTSPGNARAASSVSAVSPSCETQTRTSAVGRVEHRLERLHRARRRSARRGTTCRSRCGRRALRPAAAGRSEPAAASPVARRLRVRVSPGIPPSIPSRACDRRSPGSSASTSAFATVDAMGHVNNAVYSTYLEQARIGILGGLEPFILARVEIDFRAELQRRAQRSRCAAAARTSARRASSSQHRDLVGRPPGRRSQVSVLVGYDYARNESVPITDDLRRRLTA